MRLEFINRIKDGDILGKNIYTNDGKILLKGGVCLNSSLVNKIKELGVYYIYIEDNRLDDVRVDDEVLSELKQNTMKSVSLVMKNTYNTNLKQMNESLEAVEKLIEYLIHNADVNKSIHDIQTYNNATYLHSLNVCVMSAFLGRNMGISESELKDLGIASILHDIGMMLVPQYILNKKQELTEEERMQIREHPVSGATILKKNPSISENVIKAIIQHHERVDGRGYPYSLVKNQIIKFAKIISVCDVYDTVSSDSNYKNKFTPNDAYELIMAGCGTMFDEEVVMYFRKTFAVYPLGCCVRLSNGVEGYVINQNENFPDRPIIRVLYDSATKNPVKFYEINLLQYTHLVITSLV